MSYKEITKQSYQQTAEQFSNNVRDLAPVISIEKFITLLPANPTILDLGCGSGRDAKIFSEKGAKVVGIDYCSNLLDIACNTAPLAEFLEMDIEELSFPECSFDGVWAATSLSHIPKAMLSAVLKNIHLLLKDKGYFYLTVNKGTGEVLKKDLRYGDFEKFSSYFEEQELRKFLQDANFKILELAHIDKKHPYQINLYLRVFCQKIT